MSWAQRASAALFKDSLAKRLFLLLWLSLVLSHVLAFATVRWLHFSDASPPGLQQAEGFGAHPPPPPPPHRAAGPGAGPGEPGRLPTFPSLPPTRGLQMLEEPSGPPRGAGPGGPRPPGLNAAQTALDYGVRLLVMALAAWLGSRWLAQPMRRLMQASAGLGDAVKGRAPLPQLDEGSGTHEVREAARLFNQMARQMRQQFSERGLLVAAISHDLRTPLTRLRMRLETLSLEEGPRRAAVGDIVEMSAMIDSVLELFQGDGLASTEAAQIQDLSALLTALSDDLSEQGHAVHYSGPPARVRAQPSALRRVFGNLLGNAIRYGGSAEVSVVLEDQRVRVRIEDPGPGIPTEQLEAVFQPFYRLESSRNRHTGGTGLGLYIARDLIERQGGRLKLSNRAEGGLCAEVDLPLA
ncbi:MAG: ATP-binding protein [Paucibacter sp.]|nr:ATP-binding protein [Roseateles sp.]